MLSQLELFEAFVTWMSFKGSTSDAYCQEAEAWYFHICMVQEGKCKLLLLHVQMEQLL